MVNDGMRMPGESVEADAARIYKEKEPGVKLNAVGGIRFDEHIDLDASIAPALPNIDRVDKQTVDFAVTSDAIGVPDARDSLKTRQLAAVGVKHQGQNSDHH